MGGKPSEIHHWAPNEPAPGIAPLRRADGQLVIITVTPAVAELARVVGAIAQERKALRKRESEAQNGR
jgi:hypothetical protein